MTREVFTPSPLYTIATAGPYPITHPYQVDTEIACTIFQGTTIVELLNGTDFTVAPTSSETTGDVTLSAGIFATYTGASLLIRRISVADQGWAGQTARESGLEAQLDAITQRLQEIDEAVARAIKLPKDAAPELPLDTSGLFLGFNISNHLFAGVPIAAPSLVTPYMATLLDDPDAAAARATLGVGTGSMNNLVEDLTPQLGGPLDANGKAVFWSVGPSVTSATDLAISATGNSFRVTGSATIETIDSSGSFYAGAWIHLTFNGAATLSHDGEFLSLLGDADITVAAGDVAIFIKNSFFGWQMASFNGVTSTPDWEGGASTKPSLVSAENVKAAIDAQVPALFTTSHAASGYSVEPDGTIRQWAKISVSPWVFPIAFPSACVFVGVTSERAAATSYGADYVSSMNLVSAVIAPGSFDAYVFAIGY